MNIKALALFLLLAAPAPAQEVTPPVAPDDGGSDLMQQGLRLFFRGLMSEMEPAMDSMGKALDDMRPAIETLIGMIDDIRNYDAPVRLDNGDILIRRKPEAPAYRPLKDGETEL
jgi:hypothetical protein